MASFILAANDSETVTGRSVKAIILVETRLRKGIWPLYKNTKNRNVIAAGDRIVFYIGGCGPNKQCFFAFAKVEGVDKAKRDERFIDGENVNSSAADKIIKLANITYLEPVVSIRQFVGEFDFFPRDRMKWGVALVGGSRRIRDEYFDKIVACGA